MTKKKEKELGNLIEKTLMEAYLNGEKLDFSEEHNPEGGLENHRVSSSSDGASSPKKGKIPGVRKEDGSACCGGGCCFDEKGAFQPTMSKKEYLDIINLVLDPETAVGITDMGLIYDVEEKEGGCVKVTMTLTSLGCPAGGQITTEIDAMLRLQPHVKDVKIEVVWDPPWNPGMMNPEVKAMLFGN